MRYEPPKPILQPPLTAPPLRTAREPLTTHHHRCEYLLAGWVGGSRDSDNRKTRTSRQTTSDSKKGTTKVTSGLWEGTMGTTTKTAMTRQDKANGLNSGIPRTIWEGGHFPFLISFSPPRPSLSGRGGFSYVLMLPSRSREERLIKYIFFSPHHPCTNMWHELKKQSQPLLSEKGVRCSLSELCSVAYLIFLLYILQ
jgi:hypothetical protein